MEERASYLDLSRYADLENIDALVQIALARHLLPAHQFRTLRHVRILHHARDGMHFFALGVVGHETLLAFADVRLALDDYVVPALWCVAWSC